jgi:hypothetical protein
MMKTSEATLGQRAGYLYRHLLLLQRLFQGPDEDDSAESLPVGDEAEAVAIRAAIRDVLEELTEHARVLNTVPYPLREWQPGDGPNDERWRGLTEVERRDVLSLVSAYESLITWAEEQTHQPFIIGPRRPSLDPLNETAEYLKAERARVARFHRDLAFLERRRAETA